MEVLYSTVHLSEFAAGAATELLDAAQIDAAREFVRLGEAVQADTDEQHFGAKILRLNGRISALDGNRVLAESCYQRALAIAECQSAKLFSLRAATDLAGLLHETGRAEEAIAILQPVYNWFSGGWDYPDLQRARAMLDKIRV